MENKSSFTQHTLEIIKDRFYFSLLSDGKKIKSNRYQHFINFDEDLKYRNFFRDFGPLNISCLYKYCCKVTKLLSNFNGRKRLIHYTSEDLNKKVNAAFLVGAFGIICLKMSPMQIYQILLVLEPYKQYVDALQRTSIHTIRLYDCLKAISKALQFNLYNFNDFRVEEYDLYDQLENGNLNWIIPRKFLAFIGPTDIKIGLGHAPSFYISYFLSNDVRTVIRLNDKLYDPSIFIKAGIEHFDLFFEDGSCPGMDILLNFLRITETSPAAIAVHCKAGLGRTGTLICCYLMKHYMMSAREAVAWCRICRSGSVTGAQQAFLEDHESWLWKVGNEYRARHYGDELRMPYHKYGVCSKEWPIERMKLINEQKKRSRAEAKRNEQEQDRQYLRSIKKLLSVVHSTDSSEKIKKSSGSFTRYKL